MSATTIHHVVKFWLYDTDGVTINNIWVASSSTLVDDEALVIGNAVAKAMKILDRNGIDLRSVKFVGFEDASSLKGKGIS